MKNETHTAGGNIHCANRLTPCAAGDRRLRCAGCHGFTQCSERTTPDNTVHMEILFSLELFDSHFRF